MAGAIGHSLVPEDNLLVVEAAGLGLPAAALEPLDAVSGVPVSDLASDRLVADLVRGAVGALSAVPSDRMSSFNGEGQGVGGWLLR